MNNVDVSVVVLTYNSDIQKLYATILSAIKQRGVSVQIIVSDDGSSGFEKERIAKFLRNHGCTTFVINVNEKNIGTTKNYLSGLKYATGKYIKAISPGDYFTGDDVLSKWVHFMEDNDCCVSFSDAVFYKMSEGRMTVIPRRSGFPVFKTLYAKKTRFSLLKRIDYLVLFDHILGAAVFGRRDLICNYCQLIAENVKYTEDSMFRLMLLDGIEIMYYPENLIYYEFGTGISTSGKPVWTQRLVKDQNAFNDIVISRLPASLFEKRYQKYLMHVPFNTYMSLKEQRKNFLNQIIMFPEVVPLKLIRRFLLKMGCFRISMNVNAEFIEGIIGEADASY